VPIERLGEWHAPAGRANPVTLLENQGFTRERDLLPLRFGQMLTSPLAFYQGAAAVMAADLARTPSSGFRAQISGDANICNFVGYDSAQRRTVFDLKDFDETLAGPWEWDVKRLAASVEIAGREMCISEQQRRRSVRAAAAAYQAAMREFAELDYLDVWYARPDPPRMQQRGPTSHKLVLSSGGEVRFRSMPPSIQRLDELMPADEAALHVTATMNHIRAYTQSLTDDRRLILEQFDWRDMARRIGSIGSIGIQTTLVLFTGRESRRPLVLQVKEAGPSALEPYASPSPYVRHGRRVVEGQRLMQTSDDVLLGWVRGSYVDGTVRDYYVRQIWDSKLVPGVESTSPAGLRALGEACARILARAHALTTSRVAVAAYLGQNDRFPAAMDQFAVAYADQNERDRAELEAAAAARRVIVRAVD
jgi:uncharacterized protein (DUF2252 family)